VTFKIKKEEEEEENCALREKLSLNIIFINLLLL
jgi:hypothetical protein